MKRILCLLVFLATCNPCWAGTTMQHLEVYARAHGATKTVARNAANAIAREGKERKLSTALVSAIVFKESRYYPKAVRGGCVGMMGVNVRVWRLARWKWFEVDHNIHKGCEILSRYIAQYGMPGGLHAFKLGETAYKRGKRDHRYVESVLAEAASITRRNKA